jgi:hypothetical protein
MQGHADMVDFGVTYETSATSGVLTLTVYRTKYHGAYRHSTAYGDILSLTGSAFWTPQSVQT